MLRNFSLMVIEITCLLKRDLNSWSNNVKWILSTLAFVNFSGKLLNLSGWSWRMSISDMKKPEESNFVHELVTKEKALRDTRIRRIHEMEELRRAQELRVDEFSVQKMRESHWERFSRSQSTGSRSKSSICVEPRPERNLSETQGNVFLGNPRSMFDSSQTPYQGILHFANPSATGAIPVQVNTGRPVPGSEERIGSTTPMPMTSRRLSTMNPFLLLDIPQNSMVGQKISELQFAKFSHTFNVFMLEDKIQNPGEFLFRFSLRSHVMDQRNGDGRVGGRSEVIALKFKVILISRILICWTRGLLLLWVRSSRIPTSGRRSVWKNRKPRKRKGFLRGRQIAYMIYDYFLMLRFLIMQFYFLSLFATMMFQDFESRWDEILLSMTKIRIDDVLENLYKLIIRESDQLKNVLELYDMEIHQKISMPSYQKLKTMVKRSIDQKLRLRNVDAKNERIETGAVVTSRKESSRIVRGKGVRYQWKAKGLCSRDHCSSRHDGHERAKQTPKTASPSESPTPRGRSASRKRGLRGRSPSGKTNRQSCKNFLKGTCTKLPCDYWHPPECHFYKSECRRIFGAEFSFPHWNVEEQP